MIIKVNVGGVLISFGESGSPVKPEPFYPYLLNVDAIQDSTGDELGATSFSLHLLAQRFIGLNLRRKVEFWNDDLTEMRFAGIIGRIAYNESINITVEV